MPQIGGNIIEWDFSGRVYAPTADSDVTTKLGGNEATVEPNGDGTARVILTKTPPGFEGVVVAIDSTNGDLEFLQGLADRGVFFAASATYADGSVRQGELMITGEIGYSNQSASASFALMGIGKLTLQ